MIEIIAFSATSVALVLALYIVWLHWELDVRSEEISHLFDGLESIADGTHEAVRIGNAITVREIVDDGAHHVHGTPTSTDR